MTHAVRRPTYVCIVACAKQIVTCRQNTTPKYTAVTNCNMQTEHYPKIYCCYKWSFAAHTTTFPCPLVFTLTINKPSLRFWVLRRRNMTYISILLQDVTTHHWISVLFILAIAYTKLWRSRWYQDPPNNKRTQQCCQYLALSHSYTAEVPTTSFSLLPCDGTTESMAAV
jgi:hypothetical protein